MRKNFFANLLFLVTILFNTIAEAKRCSKKAKSRHNRIETSIVVDAASGKILHSRNSNVKIYPASLTKLMTLYILFGKVKSGKIKLTDQFAVSLNAQNAKPSKLGLKSGEKISVRDSINALIVKSANDAAIVVAEGIAGSEKRFAKIMNINARKLKMKNTNFINASGWHHPSQKTTASDLVKLTLAIKKEFPEYYQWFNKDSFRYAGRIIKGHNKVTRTYKGAEGMKTGYTNPAGYNLITTASRSGKSLVAVVTGSSSSNVRDNKMVSLLDKHFDHAVNDVFKVAEKSSKKKIVKKSPNKTYAKKIVRKKKLIRTQRNLAKKKGVVLNKAKRISKESAA